MKKIVLLLTIFISLFTLNVNATSAPYHWYPIKGGESLPTGATEEVSDKTVTLKLNNYNGNGLKLECRGTAQEGVKFIIELTGENTITDENTGLDFNYEGKIEFTGEGSLEINAPKPISYESYENYMKIKPSENIYTDQEVTKDTESDAKLISTKDKTTKEKKDEDKEYKIMNIAIAAVMGLYILISLIFIVVLTSKLAKRK